VPPEDLAVPAPTPDLATPPPSGHGGCEMTGATASAAPAAFMALLVLVLLWRNRQKQG
jgi:hypothetical protein